MNNAVVESLDRLIAATSDNSPSSKPSDSHRQNWAVTMHMEYNSTIQAASELALFDDTHQVVGNGSSLVDRNSIAQWMIERAKAVGSRQAVEDVERYIAEDTFHAFQIMLLAGLYVDQNYELGNGIHLIRPQAIPNTRIRQAALSTWWGSLPNPSVKAALILPFEHPRVHLRMIEGRTVPTDEVKVMMHDFSRLEALEDARLCLSLVGPRGPQALGTGVIAPDHVPILSGQGWSIGSFRRPRFGPGLIPIQAKQARAIHEKFVALEPAQKKKLRIPLRRINLYASENDRVQGAIELRVALDALFLDDNDRELSYRLALHAALLVGGTIEERGENRKLIRDAYNLGSSAVHNGDFSEKQWKTAHEVLSKAAKLICSSIKRMIENPQINWGVLELSGGIPNDALVLHTGPRGGKYYITEKGRKVYIS